jgi:hypothetical protein
MLTPSGIAAFGSAASARSIALSMTGAAPSTSGVTRTRVDPSSSYEGCVERLLHGGRRRVRSEPSDLHPADRDTQGDRERLVGGRQRRRNRPCHQQAGHDHEQERKTPHAWNIVKIRGSFVMIPSAPSRTSRSASLGSSTVQT